MIKIKENVMKFINRIFKGNSIPMIANISKQNYDKYHRTYDTLSKIFNKLEGIDAYLIGGISAAIQTNQDLYRQNEDIDIMCKEGDLSKLIKILQKTGYSVEDRRGIETRNRVDLNGNFQAKDHEINANTINKNMLGIGIFTYQVRGIDVITHSYAFEEKEGKFVGIEKIMPKELFDLMYDSRSVDYKGIKLKTQSKEYVYMTKSRGDREKDKLDASVIEPILDEKSKEKIVKIKKLEAKTRTYRLLYNKDGKVELRVKLPTLEEKLSNYLDYLYIKNTTKTSEQIVAEVLQSDEYHRIISNHPEIDSLIKSWEEKSKNYTYQDKVKLLTKNYSTRLDTFSKEAIDNALVFFQRRDKNYGKNNDDIELSDKTKEIFKLMQNYEQDIKKIFVDNNINITHITDIAPEKLKDGKIGKTSDRDNNYDTKRVERVFASSNIIESDNPYIACNESGMIKLNESTYIYGSNNIDVIQDTEGKKHAVLKKPNYIYYINPASFKPVCNLIINPNTNQPIFEFSGEWISDTLIDIYDSNQMRGVDEVKDITSLLEQYTILCDIQSEGIGRKAKQQKNRKETLQYVTEKINDGSVRNINREMEINDKNLSGIDR